MTRKLEVGRPRLTLLGLAICLALPLGLTLTRPVQVEPSVDQLDPTDQVLQGDPQVQPQAPILSSPTLEAISTIETTDVTLVLPEDREEIEQLSIAAETAREATQKAEKTTRFLADQLQSTWQKAISQAKSLPNVSESGRTQTRQIASLTQQWSQLKQDHQRLSKQLTQLQQAPRPKPRPLVTPSPVARQSSVEEFHLELRGDRVSVIPLEELLDLLERDARIRIRIGRGSSQVEARVGPVGSFALRYELVSSEPRSITMMINRGMSLDEGVRSYLISGWELEPTGPERGETLASLGQTNSQVVTRLSRLQPDQTSITLWTYPDAFVTYRTIRDWLNDEGFQVAGRPLPAGVPIRGSPQGSVSLVQ